MKGIIIGLSLLTTYVRAQSKCWSMPLGYPCCVGNDVYKKDVYGLWGIENDNYCGIARVEIKERNEEEEGVIKPEIPENYCWAKAKGYPCCDNDEGYLQSYDMDGKWGYENNAWCGYKSSKPQWNDREKYIATKSEWETFKIKWDDEYKDNFERLSIFAGDNESMLNFGWYSTTNKTPVIRLSSNKDMSNYKDFTGSNELYKTLSGINYYSNKVTVTGLDRNSVYYYQRQLNGIWEDPILFKTYDPDNFTFVFVGDPQIGGSHGRISVADITKALSVEQGTRNDVFNWNMTVSSFFNLVDEPSLLLSAGDQVDVQCSTKNIVYDDYNQETQYSGFLLPELLKTIPMAAALGNHDATSKNYRYHFNLPNPYLTPETIGYEITGYNFFFKYNNVLVVVLESNNSSCNDFKTSLKNAIKKYPNTDWRIALFHHDIFGNGATHSQGGSLELRPCLSKLLSSYKFDLVINGHDHLYTASHFISYNEKAENKYTVSKIEKGNVNENPKGTLYITANCSTGSKLYINDLFPYDYVNEFDQPFKSTFGLLKFEKSEEKVRLIINTYDVDHHNVTDGPYIIEKQAKTEQQCWSLRLGSPCCTFNKDVYAIDENGKWSVENGIWCGIIDDGTIPNQPEECWAKILGSPCCLTTKVVVEIDDFGKWGIENGAWCGIIEEVNTITTSTTTTTTTTTTSTTTTTTTTTTRIPTTTSIPDQNCIPDYEKCGGIGYNGPTCCENPNFKCEVINEYFHQCTPKNYY
ncbi:Metallo-dependent phosphatase [Anaeromyces robustus]|uniref:Purple acid phosphatase n=1 Tax=Anaeromyces robustus TaxID=1754192 RepID=A0A1Y1XK72_9FUNG|nr:Metallo-dependent phosphatase [Anaeromyces robustus]|eukprot:ORX85744.1 Metallo-dependent phosphatase [Anaeromyces robustus]